VNINKAKYMAMSRYQDMGRNHNIKLILVIFCINGRKCSNSVCHSKVWTPNGYSIVTSSGGHFGSNPLFRLPPTLPRMQPLVCSEDSHSVGGIHLKCTKFGLDFLQKFPLGSFGCIQAFRLGLFRHCKVYWLSYCYIVCAKVQPECKD
jgi:hypothetical protein